METQVELHNWAMHDEGLVQLRPYKVNSECVCLRMTDKERESVCVGQSYSSGPDRPLSQLLPDLQLNQHGFSQAWYFSSASQDQRKAVTGHLTTIDAIKSLCGLAVFAASSGQCEKLGR